MMLFRDAPPGSALWLLGHELRHAWYGALLNRSSKGSRNNGSKWRTLIVWAVAWALLHAFAFAILDKLGRGGMADPHLAMAFGAVLLICATFMLSNGLRASVVVLFERGDLDLLLSSPIPTRSIFTVRLLSVACSTVALFLFLFAPVANVALMLGRPGWLAIYPVLAALATLCACGGMLLTLLLVRLLGARRTRVVAQVVAALAGALLFLMSQAYNFMSQGSGPDVTARLMQGLVAGGVLAPDSLLWLPGRAALGMPLPLLGMVVVAAAVFALTVARTHCFFVHGLQQAASASRTRARADGPLRLRVRSSLIDTIVIKEWRLIARDPHLISQVLLQLIYLVPILFLILHGSDTPLPTVGAALPVLCSSLTASLAWIAVSAEDAPDLLLLSPASQPLIRLAKLAAATMPPLLLVAPALVWLVVRAPVPGLLVCFAVTGAMLGAGLIVSWVGRPAPRSDFKMRGKENLLCTIFESVNALSWGALGWLLVTMTAPGSALAAFGAAGALTAALASLLLAWLFRRRPG
jgi:ABC-2 type transport system permease protein